MEKSTIEILDFILFAVPIALVIFKIYKYKVGNDDEFKSVIIMNKLTSKDGSFILLLAMYFMMPVLLLLYILEYIFKMLKDIGGKLLLIYLVSFFVIGFLIAMFEKLEHFTRS